MKTFAELLASGSLAEIAAAIKTRSERFDALAAEAVKRVEKTSTQAELDEMSQLDDEMEKLTAKHGELKKIDDAKVRNAARVKAFNTPANPLPFGGEKDDDKDDAKKSYVPAYTSI